MSDWMSRQMADAGYSYGYYAELNPLRIPLAFLNARLAPPKEGACCELGFGQGISINIHAAASEAEWWGTDFNPAQVRFARELAETVGSDVKLFDQSFAEFCARDDLPEFAFIGLHGIWSWISNENRTVIVDFVRRKLKVGGVLYMNYNAMPGWAGFEPLRDLMVEHAEVMAAPGRGFVSRVDGALEFAEKILSVDPVYGRVNPQMSERLKSLKNRDRLYLAHEFFSRDWHPMPIAKVAEWLEPAKVGYACSANYLDHIASLHLTNEQQSFLKDIPVAMFRETVRDLFINQHFRRDYWVKGARHISSLERVEALREMKVVLSVPRADVSLKTRGKQAEGVMQAHVFEPILDTLSDHRPTTVSEIETAVAGRQISLAQIAEALVMLSGTGQAFPAQEDAIAEKARSKTGRLNRFLADRARSGSEVVFLACPLTGGAIPASRMTQLYLLATSRGKDTVDQMARYVWELLSTQGQRILKDGKALEPAQDNLDEIKLQARTFIDRQLPTLNALGIGLAS